MVQPQNKEPERTPAMKTKSVLAASLMTLAIAMLPGAIRYFSATVERFPEL